MDTFKEWLNENELEEGWKDWGKKAVVGAALAAAPFTTGCSGPDCDIPQNAPTATTAQDQETEYQRIYQQEYAKYLRVFKDKGLANEKAHTRAQNAVRAQQLKQHTTPTKVPGGYKWSGNFKHGKIIDSDKTTSNAANEFLP